MTVASGFSRKYVAAGFSGPRGQPPGLARNMPRPDVMDRQTSGKLGEDLACAELSRRGYEILERRYKSRFGEIDIVARHAGTIVFVEVKARADEAFGSGALAVTALKQRKIAQMAVDFLARRRLHHQPCRFDVVAVALGRGEPRVEVYESAFDVA
jgi:putative endonuclease